MTAVAIMVTAVVCLITGGGAGYFVRIMHENRVRQTKVLIDRVRFNALQEKAGEKVDTSPPPDYFNLRRY